MSMLSTAPEGSQYQGPLPSPGAPQVPLIEWVEIGPMWDVGKDKPVRFKARSGEVIKTHWANWIVSRQTGSDSYPVPFFQHTVRRTGAQYRSWRMPGEWVETWREESSGKPCRFRAADGAMMKCTEQNWMRCGNSATRFLALELNDQAFLTWALGTLSGDPQVER